MKVFTTSCFLFVLFLWTAEVRSQDNEFIGLVKDLLNGDELKSFQQTYANLPLEVRNKLTKDLLTNPGKLGKDILGLLGPQFQNQIQSILSSFGGSKPADSSENEVNVETDETMAMDYSKDKKRPKEQQGFDFGSFGSLVSSLMSSNPQMLLTMAQGFLQSGSEGFSLDSIGSLLANQFDLNTVLQMAANFGSNFAGNSKHTRGEGEGIAQGIPGMNKIQEMIKAWKEFMSSAMGKKMTRIVPRLLKAPSLPEALRLLEKETSFRFDAILRQLQDEQFKKILVDQTVKPIGQFIKGIAIPPDFKDLMSKADDVLNNKLGLGVKVKEFIEPAFMYIRDTYKITRESFMDLKSEDIEKIAREVMYKEFLNPLNFVWDAYVKARENTQCSQFIFCQLNKNFYDQNFIRRNVVKTTSIISAFQASGVMKKEAFSQLYEACYKGAEGYDCTNGVNSFCLDLMHTSAHSEL